MLTEKRYEDILKLVDQQRTVTVTNLSERLGASESTIRRDLLALDRMGKLVRVHGGATSIDCQYTTKDLKLDERYGMSMATDIAFALGAMSLLGDHVAPATKTFFSTLAVADDVLAIIVLALFYGQTPNVGWLAASAAVTAVLFALNHAHIYKARIYIVVGLILWYCMKRSPRSH